MIIVSVFLNENNGIIAKDTYVNGTFTAGNETEKEIWHERFIFDMIYWISLNVIISEVIFGT